MNQIIDSILKLGARSKQALNIASLALIFTGLYLVADMIKSEQFSNTIPLLISMTITGVGLAFIFRMVIFENKDEERIISTHTFQSRAGDVTDSASDGDADVEKQSVLRSTVETYTAEYLEKHTSKTPTQTGDPLLSEQQERRQKRILMTRINNRFEEHSELLSKQHMKFANPSKWILIIAISFAFIGLIPLAIVSFSFQESLTAQKAAGDNLYGVAVAYLISRIPFISLAVLLEVVAGIMLKVYYKHLDEARYYTNEMTNIMLQGAALHTGILRDDEDALNAGMRKLFETDRNRILKRGETTEEIEKMKTSVRGINLDIKTLTGIFEGILKRIKE